MTVPMRRVLPSIIREAAGGGASEYVEYANFEAVLAAIPSGPELMFFKIPYIDPFRGEGECKGMVLNGAITFFDWLPFKFFGGGWDNSDLTNTGAQAWFDLSTEYTYFEKVSGNSSVKNYNFTNTLEFKAPEIMEIEVYYEDTSASGERLMGMGIVSAAAPNVFSNGHGFHPTIYRFTNNWYLYIGSYNAGNYTFSSQSLLDDASNNSKFNPGKTAIFRYTFTGPQAASQLVNCYLTPDGETEKTQSNTLASNLSPSINQMIRLSVFGYSYAAQASRFEVRAIRFASTPQRYQL